MFKIEHLRPRPRRGRRQLRFDGPERFVRYQCNPVGGGRDQQFGLEPVPLLGFGGQVLSRAIGR